MSNAQLRLSPGMSSVLEMTQERLRATSCLHPERSDVGEFQSHSPTLDELLQPQCYSGSSKTWSRCRPQELPADTSLPCYTVSLQPVQGSQGGDARTSGTDRGRTCSCSLFSRRPENGRSGVGANGQFWCVELSQTIRWPPHLPHFRQGLRPKAGAPPTPDLLGHRKCTDIGKGQRTDGGRTCSCSSFCRCPERGEAVLSLNKAMYPDHSESMPVMGNRRRG
nr:uncharacterized protein LOC100938089 isoform X1 [Pongo abelii]